VADAPWRCSQCGTVNEPVANACRTCGRWPSLFDLERSTIEADDRVTYDEADEFAAQTVDLEHAEPEPYAPPTAPDGVPERIEVDVEEVEHEEPRPLWRRLSSFLIPIAVIVYIVISAIVNNDAG
jgi:hypothetical protein